MTTVIGIKHPDIELALLIADRQATSSNTPEKDINGRKIQASKDGMYAFGHSGTLTKDIYELTRNMYEGKIDMQKVLKSGKFPELREINMASMGTKMPNADKFSSFLIVSRYDEKPALHTCWPLGDVEPRVVTWIGSGSGRVEAYYNAFNVMSEARDYTGMQRAPISDDLVRLGLEAVRYAQGRDLYSSGLDLIALTPTETKDCVADLQEDFKEKIKRVQDKINSPAK